MISFSNTHGVEVYAALLMLYNRGRLTVTIFTGIVVNEKLDYFTENEPSIFI